MTRCLATVWNIAMIGIALAYMIYPETPRLVVCISMGALIAHSVHSMTDWWKD